SICRVHAKDAGNCYRCCNGRCNQEDRPLQTAKNIFHNRCPHFFSASFAYSIHLLKSSKKALTVVRTSVSRELLFLYSLCILFLADPCGLRLASLHQNRLCRQPDNLVLLIASLACAKL